VEALGRGRPTELWQMSAGFRAGGLGQYAPNVKATLCPPKPKEVVTA
jgi:hypothetical protein